MAERDERARASDPKTVMTINHKLPLAADALKVDRIGQQLKTVYDETLHEPLPDNLVALLAALDKRG
jgi:hypothetical protein